MLRLCVYNLDVVEVVSSFITSVAHITYTLRKYAR